MSDEEQCPTSYQRIGICMSGGGFRAASFHLGTLSYLYEIGLGPKIRMMSTVSGGTFIGISYALALKDDRIKPDGQGFKEYFREVAGYLATEHLVKKALDVLENADQQIDTPSRRQDFIMAMAQTYADGFLAKDGNARLMKDLLEGPDTHLEDAIFNATEFKSANAFRFWATTNPERYSGNKNYAVERSDMGAARLADVLAASSCFPGGFEPLAFPGDFAWQGDMAAYRRISAGDGFNTPVALMDGGIYDNQGIYSLTIAEKNAVEEGRPPLDLFIISDSTSWKRPFYDMPEPAGPSWWGKYRLRHVDWAVRAVYVLCLAGALGLIGRSLCAGTLCYDLVFYAIPIMLCALTCAGLWGLRRFVVNRILALIPQGGADRWSDLKNVSLREVYDLILLRYTSVQAMVFDIFMARIRSLGFDAIYRPGKYRHRRVSVLIYSLIKRLKDHPTDAPKPSDAVKERVRCANDMGTTLWFTPKELKAGQLDALIEAGQMTMCYNLLKRLDRSLDTLGANSTSELEGLRERALEHWKRFQDDTGWLRKSLMRPRDGE